MGDGVDAILRARMGSSRLPGKVLMPAAGKPMLLHLVERLRRSCLLSRVVVATSDDPSDDSIADLCAREEIPCFRGSEEDVLDRYYRCAQEYGMGHIAILYADNPLIDPSVCDEIVKAYRAHVGKYDYVSNVHPPTYPDGQEIEICTFATLQTAWREARKPFQREHVTPFIWDQPERFRCFNVMMEPNLHHERWTLDYPEDYEFLRLIFEGLYFHKPDFSMWDVIAFLDAHPGVRKIPAMHAGTTWHTANVGELKTIHREEM